MAEAVQRLVELDDGVSLNIAEAASGQRLLDEHRRGRQRASADPAARRAWARSSRAASVARPAGRGRLPDDLRRHARPGPVAAGRPAVADDPGVLAGRRPAGAGAGAREVLAVRALV